MDAHLMTFRNGSTLKVTFTGKKIGKKIGNHLKEIGRDPSSQADRDWFQLAIKQTIDAEYRHIRLGEYHEEGDCYLIYTNEYAVIIRKTGEFVTFYALNVQPLSFRRIKHAAIPLTEREWFKRMKEIE